MTKKLLNLSKITLLILSFSFLFGSCTEEKTFYIDPEGEFAYVLLKENIKIETNQWKWDPATARYKVSIAFPELRENDYNFGMAIGNVYIIGNDGKESVYPMPYIRSYFQGDITFTETISCALSYNKKNVEFYIEPSDKFEDPEAPNTYYFKVALIYNFNY